MRRTGRSHHKGSSVIIEEKVIGHLEGLSEEGEPTQDCFKHKKKCSVRSEERRKEVAKN